MPVHNDLSHCKAFIKVPCQFCYHSATFTETLISELIAELLQIVWSHFQISVEGLYVILYHCRPFRIQSDTHFFLCELFLYSLWDGVVSGWQANN